MKPFGFFAIGCLAAMSTAHPRATLRADHWVAAWAASPHGPYPSGNPSAQPDLSSVLENAEAVDQTFRLIVKPDLWGKSARLRFTNVFGARTVVIDDVFVGVQSSGGNVAAGTNRQVTFMGKSEMAVPAGGTAISDAVDLAFVKDPADRMLDGRKLAVSFHVVGASGPMTWHAKALQTSYLTAPRSGSHGRDETDSRFTFTTTSWYFLDAFDVMAPEGTVVIACFGDSITDGTASTLNGDDRWPDVLSRRLHAKYGARVSVVNAGIGGNRVTSPPYSAANPVAGGPSAVERFERDVASLSGVRGVIWLEGINDLGAGVKADTVIAGMKDVAARGRARGLKMFGATIVPSLGSTTAHGTTEADAERQAINAFIKTPGSFDGVFDFDLATRDPATGGLRAAYQPNSTIGGPGDRVHPNRAGYQAMGNAVDLDTLAGLFARR